jgi:sortase A
VSQRLRIGVGYALVAVGTGLLAYWLAVRADAWMYDRRMARILNEPPSRLAPASADRKLQESDTTGLIGRIEIPRLRLSALILEGTSGRTLQRGVGHVRDTALPGESDNIGLAAHRDTYFGKLAGVSPGDLVLIRTPARTFAYRVDTTLIVTPDRGDLLEGSGQPALTLVTCYPFHWIGPAPRRFVVRARPVDGWVSSLARDPRRLALAQRWVGRSIDSVRPRGVRPWAATAPPWRSTISRTIARPSPEPGSARAWSAR